MAQYIGLTPSLIDARLAVYNIDCTRVVYIQYSIPGVISLAVGGVFSNVSSASVRENGIWHNSG